MAAKGGDAKPVRSPLARLLHSLKDDEGLSFREMERRVTRAGMQLSDGAIGQIARDERAYPLEDTTIEALAAATGRSFAEIKDLDGQRFGFRYIVTDKPDDDELVQVFTKAFAGESPQFVRAVLDAAVQVARAARQTRGKR